MNRERKVDVANWFFLLRGKKRNVIRTANPKGYKESPLGTYAAIRLLSEREGLVKRG